MASMAEKGAILAYCNCGVFILLICVGIAIINSKDYLTAVVNLCMFSVLSSLAFLLMGAPDVAITEASINACLSGIILLGAGKILGFDAGKKNKSYAWLLMLAPLSGACIICASFAPIGSGAVAESASLYMNATIKDIGIHNAVTAVLASFRGYDTLWETVVVLTAAIATLTVLRKDNAT